MKIMETLEALIVMKFSQQECIYYHVMITIMTGSSTIQEIYSPSHK